MNGLVDGHKALPGLIPRDMRKTSVGIGIEVLAPLWTRSIAPLRRHLWSARSGRISIHLKGNVLFREGIRRALTIVLLIRRPALASICAALGVVPGWLCFLEAQVLQAEGVLRVYSTLPRELDTVIQPVDTSISKSSIFESLHNSVK